MRSPPLLLEASESIVIICMGVQGEQVRRRGHEMRGMTRELAEAYPNVVKERGEARLTLEPPRLNRSQRRSSTTATADS